MYVCITPVCKRGVFTGFGVIITTYLLTKTRTKKKEKLQESLHVRDLTGSLCCDLIEVHTHQTWVITAQGPRA